MTTPRTDTDPSINRMRPPLRRSSTTTMKDGGLEARTRTEASTASASTSRISSASSTRRWSEAVRTVMLQQEQHRQADDLKNTEKGGDRSTTIDKLGDCLTQMLNKHPQFQRQVKPRIVYDDTGDFGVDADSLQTVGLTYPLISRHNVRVARHFLGTLSGAVTWQEIPCAIKRIISQLLNFFFKERPSFRSCLGFLVAVVLGLLVAIAYASHMLILYSAQAAGLIGGNLFFLLIDLEDLRHNCPDTVWNLLATISDAWQWFDAQVMLGRRFVGREWNKTDFEWNDPAQAASDKSTLWELPPPSVKKGRRLCLSLDYMARPEWSRDTVRHMVAVDFCYIMLREDHLRKQASGARQSFARNNDEGEQIAHPPVTKRSSSTSALPDRKIRLCDDASSSVVNVMPSSARHRRFGSGPMDTSNSSIGEAYEMEVGNDSERADSSVFDNDFDGVLLSDNNDFDLDGPEFNQDRFASDHSIASDSSEVAADLPWIDVGAKIGIRLLNSAHVQRAMASQETTDRLFVMSKEMESKFSKSKDRGRLGTEDATSTTVGSASAMLSHADGDRDPEALSEAGLSKPVHSMWTSPAAAAPAYSAASSLSDTEYASLVNALQPPPIPQSQPPNSRFLPPLSPRNSVTGVARRKSSEPIASRILDTLSDPGVAPTDPVDGLDVPKICHHGVLATDEMSSIAVGSDNGGAVEILLNATKVNPSPVDSRLSLLSTLPAGAKPETTKADYRRAPLLPGVKVAVPIFPLQPRTYPSMKKVSTSHFQMATVSSSKRIYVGSDESLARRGSNCLSVTVKLDKSFLRNGEFAEMTFRVMDEWSPRYMPKHSKVPVGASVATTYGLCILVGWRVENDSHVMRSLWQRRGPGAAHAYLNRNAIHSTVEAAVGFRVQTKFGWGHVLAYRNGGRTFESGRFFVAIKEEGRFNGNIIELNRKDVLSCHGAQFIPVIEHVREAANYQIQVDNYNAALREHHLGTRETDKDEKFWNAWTECLEIIWTSFLKAVDEDKDFDDGVNEFMTSVITFLDRLDSPSSGDDESDADPGMLHKCISNDFEVECIADKEANAAEQNEDDGQEPGFWFMNDILGGLFKTKEGNEKTSNEDESVASREREELSGTDHHPSFYDKIFATLRTLMKTVTIARASSVDYPHFRLALAIAYDGLLFVRTIFRVQQKNVSEQSLEVWKRALDEIISTFGPIKERLEKISHGIAQRMEKQGRRAKIRVLKFVDTILGDERLLFAMEQGEWDQCALRLEIAIIHAKILDEKGLEQYRKIGRFVFDHLQMVMAADGSAAERNNEKLAFVAHAVQWIASPRRSLLKLLRGNDVLELLERILVRVFYNEELASRALTIHASNFHSLRHLRLLKDFSVAGRIWMPLLDAADEEFSWVTSRMPDNTKEFMCTLSSLFSLCVAQFHKIYDSELSRDWLDFLLEKDAVRIIHDIDMRLILALESFSRDVKEMFVVLPYYPSIDEDILNLMDEVDLDEFLREASDAVDDPEKLMQFIREKATVAIERFLNYLPKLSIPVEKRELGEGWVLSCHGEDGGDLTLSDVKIRRENLVCQIMGGDALFFPMFGDDDTDLASTGSAVNSPSSKGCNEESILDHIRDLLLQARLHGCWKAGVGGIGEPPSDRYVASVLQGLPVTGVLNCAIELWRSLEIDDDELLEIAVRDVSYQIQLHKEIEEGSSPSLQDVENGRDSSRQEIPGVPVSHSGSSLGSRLRDSPLPDANRRRFNPRVDPTVLFLEMTNLTLQLDKFLFRIEKDEKRTIFDPVFEGCGMLSIQNISIKLRVECAKERSKKTAFGHPDVSTPILQLRELDVGLEQVKLKVKDTVSDWAINKVVNSFSDNITQVLEENLKEQILEQTRIGIENLNSYFLVNPDMLLSILGISMEDLEENVVWV